MSEKTFTESELRYLAEQRLGRLATAQLNGTHAATQGSFPLSELGADLLAHIGEWRFNRVQGRSGADVSTVVRALRDLECGASRSSRLGGRYEGVEAMLRDCGRRRSPPA